MTVTAWPVEWVSDCGRGHRTRCDARQPDDLHPGDAIALALPYRRLT